MALNSSSGSMVHTRTYQGRLLQFRAHICGLGTMLFMCGCLGYPNARPPHLQAIEGRANAFRMAAMTPGGAVGSNEYINIVRVFEWEASAGATKRRRLCWEVIAMGYVRAGGLEIVAGQTPQGFVQVHPARGEVFEPVPGRTYEIAVVTNHPSDRALGVETPWVAARIDSTDGEGRSVR